MASRSPRAAVLDFVAPYSDVLRCVTDVGFVARGSRPGGLYEASLQGGFVSLRRGRGLDPLWFRVSIEYSIIASVERRGWWDVRLDGWIYEIRTATRAPILYFHWHPRSGRVAWPHLHAYGTHDAVELHKLHPPTGPVTAGGVVRFLIDDLDVLPHRSDWLAVLDRQPAM